MSLSSKQKKVLNEMANLAEFRRQKRIQSKLISKNRVDHIGKGYYYYIDHSRPEERIMDIITDDIKIENGGYVRILHHWKKGNKCNTELLDNYEEFNKFAANLSVGTQNLYGRLNASLSENLKYNNILNQKGETNCDILVVQIGGDSNGCCCKGPSKVEGNLIIKTITDTKLSELKRLENKSNSNCLIM